MDTTRIKKKNLVDLKIRSANDSDLDAKPGRSAREIEIDNEWMDSTSVVEVIVYQEAVALKSYGWEVMPGIKVEEEVVKWLTTILEPHDSPVYQQIIDHKILAKEFAPDSINIRHKYTIPIIKLQGKKDEQELFDAILRQADQPEWMVVKGVPEENTWHIQVDVKEEYDVKKNQMAPKPKSLNDDIGEVERQKLISQYNKTVSDVAVAKDEDIDVIKAAVGEFLSQRGVPDVEVEIMDSSLLKKVVDILNKVDADDIEV